MNLKNQKDFFAGLLFMALGVGFAWRASRYSLGQTASMGPGYFPLLLGAVLTLLGGILFFKALVFETEDGGRIGAWAWRALCFIALANGLFGALMGGLPWLGLQPMGLVIASLVLTLLAAKASTDFRWKEGLALALVLTLLGCIACIVLLKLQIPAWPFFATV